MLRRLEQIDTLIVHCADTPDGAPYSIYDIDFWHKQRGFQRSAESRHRHERGLEACGYHRVYGVNGVTWEGRELCEIGAHASGYNDTSLGLCLIGRTRFTVMQWHSLRRDAEEFLRRWPGLRVIGHRDVHASKQCPGFSVAAWLVGGMAPLAGHILEV